MAADTSIPSAQIMPNAPFRPAIGRVKDLNAGPHGRKTSIFTALAERAPDYNISYTEFNKATVAQDIGTDAFFQYAESNAGATDPAKLTPTAAKESCVTIATTANAYNQNLLGPKAYTADLFPFIEVRLMVSQVTDFSMVIGFADAVAASAGAIVSDIDTPAVATVADGAFYAIDISQTLKTAALVAVGTSTAVSKVNVAPTAAPFGVPTASTFFTVRLQLAGAGVQGSPAAAYLFINDALVATNLGGPDSEKLLKPVYFHGSPGGTAFVADIDYIKVGAQKAASPF